MAQTSYHPTAARGPWLSSVVLVLIAGIGLIYLGSMRVVTGLILLPSDASLDSIQQLKPVSDPALDRLIDAQGAALALSGNPHLWGHQGLALWLKATAKQQAGAGADQITALQDEAKADLVRSLEGVPANPYVWTRLAAISEGTSVSSETILAYWRYAQLTGPNEPRLRFSRVQIGIPLWNIMSDADRALLARDLLSGWPADQAGIVSLADNNFARAVVRSSLLADLQKLIQFEKELAKTQKAVK